MHNSKHMALVKLCKTKTKTNVMNIENMCAGKHQGWQEVREVRGEEWSEHIKYV